MRLLLLLCALAVRVSARICATADNCDLLLVSCADTPGPSILAVARELARTICSRARRTTGLCPNPSANLENRASYLSIDAAEAACRAQFGETAELIVPGDAAVNDQVRTMCSSAAFFDMKRGSGADCNTWYTRSGGEPITFFSWDVREPENGGEGNCVDTFVQEGCAGQKFRIAVPVRLLQARNTVGC